MKKRTIIKILVSLGLLALAFSLVEFGDFLASLKEIPFSVFALVLVGYITSQILSALKWHLILKRSHVSTSFYACLRAYFIGMFVNCFGLGLVGGDVARGIIIARNEPVKTAAFASVVADRAHGLAVLMGIGLIAILWLGAEQVDANLTWILSIATVLIFLGWYLGPKLLLKCISKKNKYYQKAEQIALVFPAKPGLMMGITLASGLSHVIQIALHYCIGVVFNAQFPFWYLFIAIPVVNTLSSLPISWNGLGVRENSFLAFFTPQFLTSDQVVAMGAVWIVTVAISSAIGGMIALLTDDYAYLKRTRIQKDTLQQIESAGLDDEVVYEKSSNA